MTYEEQVIIETTVEAAARISAVANMVARAVDVTGERHIAQCLEAIEEMADALSATLAGLEEQAADMARTRQLANA